MAETAGESNTKRSSINRWSIVSTVALPALGLILAWSFSLRSGTGFVLTLATLATAFVVSVICLGAAVLNAVRLRWWSASLLCWGLALGGLTIWYSPRIGVSIMRLEDDQRFARQRSAFEAVVEEERRRNDQNAPLRIVLEVKDYTLIAIANSFYYIIYDETDEAGRHPESVRGFWRCPTSETGVYNVGAPTDIKRIDGHYYRYWTSS